jgi:hypothetical protein
MKTGKSLTQLAQELERIRESAKDYVVPTAQLAMDESGKLRMGERTEALGLTNWSASQLATYTDIPKNYFDRIRAENPALLSRNVNHGLAKIANEAGTKAKPESRMLRTIDGNVRGFLSSRYRRLDSYDLLETVFPVMQSHQLTVESAELTERRLYIKATTARLQSEVKKGDVVQYGLVISTSDVGSGSVRVEPLIYRLVCSNGMIADTAMRKFHVGKDQGGDMVEELLSDSTKELTDRAFWAQVKDVVEGSMRPEVFNAQVDRLRAAAGEQITNFDLPRVVELAMKATGVTGEGTRNSIVAALASGNEGAGMTKYGLINAFTRAAQSKDVDYDQATDLERAGGAILTLNPNQWRAISAA